MQQYRWHSTQTGFCVLPTTASGAGAVNAVRHVSRRKLLLAGAMLPKLTSCATAISKHRDRPAATLAKELGVCAATYATLKSATPGPVVSISGCSDSSGGTPADAIFQAASLTKPVIAFGALRLALDGHLDLQSPVSRYLSGGYTHYHSALARSPADSNDIVPASALSGLAVAALLNHTSGFPNWASGKLSLGIQNHELALSIYRNNIGSRCHFRPQVRRRVYSVGSLVASRYWLCLGILFSFAYPTHHSTRCRLCHLVRCRCGACFNSWLGHLSSIAKYRSAGRHRTNSFGCGGSKSLFNDSGSLSAMVD